MKTPAEAVAQAREAMLNAELEHALELIQAAYKKWPKDFLVAYYYAQFLGDRAAGRVDKESQRQRKQAAKILRRLCQSLRGRTPDERWKVRRHYYRFIEQHLRVRALGKEEIRRGNKSGVLSVGFGCLDHALQLWNKQQFKSAEKFAAEAEEAFQEILQIEPPQFNRYLAYSVSLALQGKSKAASAATDAAARLVGKPSDSFTDHNALIRSILNSSHWPR